MPTRRNDVKCNGLPGFRSMLPIMTQPSQSEIAENVRAAKARRRVSDATLAAAVGMSRSAMNDRMNGRAKFQVHELLNIADFLDVTLGDLLAPTGQEVTA